MYLPKNLYKIENNKVIYSDLIFKKNIIFESNFFCPITCHKYKEISIEISNIYQLYYKNNNILYNKNIPIKYINEFINLELNDKKSQSILLIFFSNRWMALGFRDKHFQLILSIFFFNRWMAFGLYDKKYQSILSIFFFNRLMAFGLNDKHFQLILSIFFSNR